MLYSAEWKDIMKKKLLLTALAGLNFICLGAEEQKANDNGAKEQVVSRQHKVVTLPEAINKALQNGVALQIAEAQESGASLSEKAILLQTLLPSLSLGMRLDNNKNMFSSGDDEKLSATRVLGDPNVSLEFGYTLFDGFKSSAALGKAAAERDLAEAGVKNAHRTLVSEVVQAYLNILTAQKSIEAAEKNIEQTQNLLKRAQTEYEIGQSTKTNVLAAEAKVAEAKATLAKQKVALVQGNQLYKRVVGEAPVRLQPPALNIMLPSSVEEAVQLSNVNNYEVIKAVADHDKSTLTFIQAGGAFLPKVSASLKMTRKTPLNDLFKSTDEAKFSKTIGLTLEMNLFNGGADILNTWGAAKQKTAARLAVENARQKIEEKIAKTWEEIRAAKATLEQTRLGEKAYELMFEAMKNEERLGKSSFLDLLKAQNEYFNSVIARVEAEQAVHIKMASLLELTGTLTVDALGVTLQKEEMKE